MDKNYDEKSVRQDQKESNMWYVYYEVLVEGRIEKDGDVYEWEEWEMEHFLHYSKGAVARCAVWYAKRALKGKTRNLLVQEYVSE